MATNERDMIDTSADAAAVDGGPDGATAPKRRRRRAVVEPDVELGSLSQNLPVPRGTKVCRACGTETLTRVPMKIGDGTEVTFVSCQDCEERVWVTVESGEFLELADILARSGKADPK